MGRRPVLIALGEEQGAGVPPHVSSFLRYGEHRVTSQMSSSTGDSRRG
jgi:hypothetical protein